MLIIIMMLLPQAVIWLLSVKAVESIDLETEESQSRMQVKGHWEKANGPDDSSNFVSMMIGWWWWWWWWNHKWL